MFKKFIILLIFLFAEFIAGTIFDIGAVRPPLFAATLIIIFWDIGFMERFFWALGAGAFLDLFSPVPFGAFLFAFFCVLGATELWKRVFSDTESLLSQGLGATLSIAVWYFSIVLFSSFLYRFSFDPSSLGSYQNILFIVFIGIFWAAVLSFFYFFPKFILCKARSRSYGK